MNNADPRPRIRVAGLVVLALATVAALVYWREPLWRVFSSQELVQERVAALGAWGPLASVGLNTVQVLLAPVPGYVIGLANGYLYGIWLGTLYSMLGLLIGTAIAMVLGRRFGRPLVERLVKPETLSKWDTIAANRGPLFFFLVFLVPGLPDDLVCFTVGLSPLAIPRMVVLALLGRLPGVFVSSWIGANAPDLPAWAWIPLIAGVVAIAWLFMRYGDRFEAFALRAIQVLSKRRTSGAAHDPCGPEEDCPEPD